MNHIFLLIPQVLLPSIAEVMEKVEERIYSVDYLEMLTEIIARLSLHVGRGKVQADGSSLNIDEQRSYARPQFHLKPLMFGSISVSGTSERADLIGRKRREEIAMKR